MALPSPIMSSKDVSPDIGNVPWDAKLPLDEREKKMKNESGHSLDNVIEERRKYIHID